MALTYKNDNEQDERLNPSSEASHDLYHQEQEAGQSSVDREFDDIVNNYDKTAEEPTKNVAAAKKQEEKAGEKENPGHSWTTNVNGKKEKLTAKGFLKKKGPMGLIISLVLGGGGAFSFIVAPGIGIVHLKEVLVGDLNDQVGAMSLRSDKLLRAKLKSMQGVGLCSNAVSIRCKFATMSKRQVNKFKKAGFDIEPAEADKRFGRTKMTSLTFPATAEGGPRVTVTNPNELRNHLIANPSARSAMRKAFNPTFSGLWDKVSDKVFAKFKTDKSAKAQGATDEERDKAVDAATAGEKAGINAEGHYTDDKGNYVLDDDGNKVYESGEGSNPDKFKEISEKNKVGLADIASKAGSSSIGSKAVSGTLKSGLKGLSVIGAADTACTVYNAARAVAAAAKVARALQLVQFAMVFLNVADRIKAGTATEGEVRYLGDNFTAVDGNKTVIDESSVWEGDNPQDAVAKAHDNPYYGMSGFDSPGFKTAAYNEAPLLTTRDLQYTVGGGLTGTLANVLDSIAKVLGGRDTIRSTCKVVQSWWARAAGLIAGIVSAIGTFGVATAVSIGASVAIGFALPFLESALGDIIAGTVVSSHTKGIDSGDATFSGSGQLLGDMAAGHGMMPASSGQLEQYMAINNQVKAEYVAADVYDAKQTPLDIYNQYSFLGSALRTINPAILKSASGISNMLTGIPSIISSGMAAVVPHVDASQAYNADRYKRCGGDDGYKELGIDADVFCNVRYALTPEQLAIDPDDAAQWMIDHGQANEDGSPKSDDYQDWVDFCTVRSDGWGESGSDDNVGDKDVGKICVTKDKNADQLEKLKYYGVAYMDKTVNESMDDPIPGSDETAMFSMPDTAVADDSSLPDDVSMQPPAQTAQQVETNKEATKATTVLEPPLQPKPATPVFSLSKALPSLGIPIATTTIARISDTDIRLNIPVKTTI
jgi:hypothetical protein